MPDKAVFLFAASQGDDVVVGCFAEGGSVGIIVIPGELNFSTSVQDRNIVEKDMSAVGVEGQHKPLSEGFEHIENALEHILVAEFLSAQFPRVTGRGDKKPAEAGNK